MRRAPLLLLMLIALALAAVAAGCGGNGDDGEAAGTSGGTSMTDMEMDMEMSSGSGGVTGPAADLRVTLDTLLGEHALLAMFATQKGFSGEKDFEAIAGAVDANSVDLSKAIGSVYGEEAGQKFLDGDALWRAHVGFFVDYTTALAKKDKAGQEKAVNDLMGYVEAFSAFLSDATGLPQDALRDAISEHVTQLKGQLDSYAGGNYEQAYSQLREAYAHMFMTGDTLTGGIVGQMPEEFESGDVTGPASDLRVTLGRLLGEHAVLAMVATQKGYSGAKDFKAIAAALDANSVDLSEAIGSVYGQEAGQKFLDGDALWRDHIGFFVDYTVALAKKDKAGQDKAVNDLMGYVEAFSAFLSKATGLPQAALRESIAEHVNQLKGQIDAYAAGDYEQAYALAREAFAHMVMTGDTLAGAIVKQSPEKFEG
jgi:hypothetical protein